MLGVTRIGHGSHIADDTAALAWAAGEGVAIEVCPTSNVLTGAARSIREHPIHAFLDAGCRVVIGDDNPINIGTRLAAEERRLVEEGGVSEEDMARIHRTASRSRSSTTRRARRSGRGSPPPSRLVGRDPPPARSPCSGP